MAVIFLGPVLYLFLDVCVEGQLRVDGVWEVDLDSLEAYLLCVIGKGPTWHLSERARSKKVGLLLTREESRYVKGEGALRGREETYSPRIPRELRSWTPACAHHRLSSQRGPGKTINSTHPFGSRVGFHHLQTLRIIAS